MSLGVVDGHSDGDEAFHGWRISGKALHVGYLPGRKQICLYVLDGSTIRTLAFFTTREKAGEAMDMLDKIARATGVIE